MVRCGIAGWIDRSLLDSRLFYPLHVTSSEERLQFYASQFPLVEVDSTYYGMPSRKNSELWVGRTPAGFLFDVKSFSLFTHHPTRANALPPELREGLSQKQRERNLYLDQLPPDLVDEAWDWFRDALEPLKESGRLGAVFFQFPPWFLPSSRSLTYLEEVQERMAGFAIAVEFRRREWLDERRRADTLGFLRARALPLVAVDVPAGFPTSLPPLSDVTSDQLAVVRFHGRNRETWNLKGAPPSLRFRHLYSEAELSEWVPRIKEMERSARQVHAIMNNNYADYSVRNARMLDELLARWHD